MLSDAAGIVGGGGLRGGVPPIRVGDRTVADPLAVYLRYCGDHGGTLCHYDWLAGTTDSLTPELIKATRRPWMNSRISREQERWLLDRAATAPWAALPKDALLHDADPVQRQGLSDDAVDLYGHFPFVRTRGLSTAKISKCLYLMRPGLFPILDSRLVARYRVAAREAAKALAGADRPPLRRAYWAAIRQDLLRARDELALLRSRARETAPNGVTAPAAARLSDVRLLDILAWSPEPTTGHGDI